MLEAFAKKEATMHAVMRALVEYDGWLVPIHGVTDMQGQHVAVDYPVVMFSQQLSVPLDKLLVFTDRAEAERAATKYGREVLGLYAEKVPGTVLFGRLEGPSLSAVQELRVNPASPTEHQWFIGRGGFVVAGAWADAVSLDRKLADIDESLFGALKNYEGWWVPVAKSDKTIVQLELDGGPHALAFTAPDEYEKFLAKMGPRASQIDALAGFSSAKLLPLIMSTKLSGLLVNARTPLSRDTIEVVLGS
ncbi:MAG TPA: hypothetical protein VGH87_14220 [Polyangiaceae bacterium]